MKLDRNVNKDGRGKYALVRLRNIEKGSEAYGLLNRLEQLGHLDWGVVGQPDEFFVIKLRDKYAGAALRAYADAVQDDVQYAIQVLGVAARAGVQSPFCKEPD